MSDEPKPSDFTGSYNPDEEEAGDSTSRRKFLYFGGAAGLGFAGGYTANELLNSEDNLECTSFGIRDSVMEDYNLKSALERFEPDEDGYFRFEYDIESDNWYFVSHEESGESSVAFDENSIRQILSNTGEDEAYDWGEEVVRLC